MNMRSFLGVGLFLAPLAACVVSIDGGSCSVHAIHGSGVSASVERAVPAFSRVEVRGSADVVARVGAPTSLRLTGDDNLLQHVTTEVQDDTLVVSMQPGSYDFECDLEVELVTPRLVSFAVSGSSDAELEGFQGGPLALHVSGSGDVRATGRVDSLSVSITGSGDMRLEQLDARAVEVSIAGSGSVGVSASESLDVRITGSGDVRYRGQPVLSQQVTGSGDVRQD